MTYTFQPQTRSCADCTARFLAHDSLEILCPDCAFWRHEERAYESLR